MPPFKQFVPKPEPLLKPTQCVACEGIGRSTTNRPCVPCGGTGVQGGGKERRRVKDGGDVAPVDRH